MAVLLEWPRIHEAAATNRPQVDQNYQVGFIFDNVFIKSSFNELNQ